MKPILSISCLFFFISQAYSSIILLDQVPLPDVSPTTYFIADESQVSCKGRYAGVDYYGDEKSEATGYQLHTAPTRVFLGSFSGEQPSYKGLIDDVRIYDRALSANEVQALYNLGQ